jgi:hypothetical protein
MNKETNAMALQLAQLLADWRFLRRDQVAWLLPGAAVPLDPLLADLVGEEVLHLEHAPQGPDTQAVYGLGRAGAALAASHLGIDRAGLTKLRRRSVVGPLFLRHSLAVNDVRLCFLRSAQAHPVHSLTTWRYDLALPDRVPWPGRPGAWLPVRPDGYLTYRTPDHRLDAFVEADLGTVTNRRWALRTQAYIAYRFSGRFHARYGVPSFRVLTVTTTRRRMANLLATTRRAGGRALFWFTTFDLLTSQLPLSPIWSAAGAGRIDVAGSVVSSRSDAPDSVPSGDDRPSLSGQRGGR